MQSIQCSVCGSSFSCDANSKNSHCWCNRYPAIMPLDDARGCQCPSCLAKTIAARLNQFFDTRSHEQIIELAAQYRNQDEPVEHIDYCIENGSWVFSRWYHLKRGQCCGNGCRNCPY